jgi:type IV secretory pathway VirJ component
MINVVSPLRLALCALGLLLPFAHPLQAAITEETVETEIGTVHVVRPQQAPKGLVLYLAGRRGWDPAAAATAQGIAELAYLVVGIRLRGLDPANRSEAGACWNIGKDVEWLDEWAQSHYTQPVHARPILLGEAEGASLAYVAQLQSPPNSFHASIGLGFCPDLAVNSAPCTTGRFSDALLQGGKLHPVDRVESTWFVFPARNGQGCSASEVAKFVDRVDNARVVEPMPGTSAPAAGQDRPAPLTELLQWLDPRIIDQVRADASQAEIKGLPLTEVRATGKDHGVVAVMLSGDGGWAALDRGVAAALATQGISTVGWDSLSYYWHARTPTETSADLARILRHYLKAWGAQRVALIGYSFGADVLPFAADGLPPDLRQRVALIALLGAGKTAAFEFHLTDWLGTQRDGNALPVLPAVERLAWARRLCVYGAKETESACPELSRIGVTAHRVRGDHHFDGDYQGVAGLIIGQLGGGDRGTR